MKKIRLALALCFTLALMSVFAGCSDSDVAVRGSSKNDKSETTEFRHKVYLITMNKASNYWKLLDGGCKEAIEDMGGDIDYKWIAPNNNDPIEQGECIKKAVAEGANAIIISCVSPTEGNSYIEKAKEAGVKIVYVDSSATVEAVATLETDGEKAGEIAGHSMLKTLRDKGVQSGVIGLTAGNHSKNAENRIRGFKNAVQGTPYTLSDVVYMEGDRQEIRNFVKNHPDYIGFFGSNSQTTFAIGEALKETGNRPVFIAFDTADVTLMMLKDGIVTATMQQNTHKMGYDGMKIAVDALDGKITEEGQKIDTGITVIRRDEM